MRDWNEWGITAPSPVPMGSIVDYVLSDGQTIMRHVVGTSGIIKTQQGGRVLALVGRGVMLWTKEIEAWRFSDDDSEARRERYAEAFKGMLETAPAAPVVPVREVSHDAL
ncbi:hypothetical protein [Asticcacaulis taihuensis]|uniref:hypothetical protein n=1 Tax=Asticcacaulis taihuensis TaxID=260084 RepID=UPI0026F0F5F3|nr:hypothetical protein [Asticcacaulis taihuensis]